MLSRKVRDSLPYIKNFNLEIVFYMLLKILCRWKVLVYRARVYFMLHMFLKSFLYCFNEILSHERRRLERAAWAEQLLIELKQWTMPIFDVWILHEYKDVIPNKMGRL